MRKSLMLLPFLGLTLIAATPPAKPVLSIIAPAEIAADPANRLLSHPFEHRVHCKQERGDHRQNHQRIDVSAVHHAIEYLLDEDRRSQIQDRAKKAEREQRRVDREKRSQLVEKGRGEFWFQGVSRSSARFQALPICRS